MTETRNSDKRRERRYIVKKDGEISAIDLEGVIQVTICDISLGGARLRIPPGFSIPELFDLKIVSESLIYSVRKCWSDGQYVGVSFVGQPHHVNLSYAKPSEIGHNVSHLPSHDPIVFNGTVQSAIGSDHTARIEPCYNIRLSRSTSFPDRGVCYIDVLLRNREPIAAYHPFFCIPVVSIKIGPAQGWIQQDIVSVRKMKRYSSLRELVLEAGSAVHCCTIALPFKATFGGKIEYEAGSEHAVTNLPDFKLMCVAGAGNYPTERLLFTVPGKILRSAIEEEVVANFGFLQSAFK